MEGYRHILLMKKGQTFMSPENYLPEELIRQLDESLRSLPYIRPEDIPRIDLYMDQVTSFMDEHLGQNSQDGDGRVLTKTMINNYAKNKLLPPPVKKKYSAEHMLILVFIYYFKGILSLQDIHSLLGPLSERFFHTDNSVGISGIYSEVMEACSKETDRLRADISGFIEKAGRTFQDADEKDRDFLRYFALVCYLSIDVYMKRYVIEQLIEGYPSPNPRGKR